MESTESCSGAQVAAAPGYEIPAEGLKPYVIRRALEVKRYQRVADATGVNFHWLRKLAKGSIPKPNYDDIWTLFQFYRGLELGTRTLD